MLEKPFNPDRKTSIRERREKVDNYIEYLTKTCEKPEVIKLRANILRDSLGLFKDIDTEFMAKPGKTGSLVAKAIISTIKIFDSPDGEKIFLQSLVENLQEELEKREHNEFVNAVKK